ncbi:MAG: aldehyde dehydrogenase family protein [Actinobacteria bacterium]|uniref:aldehyde dehydrogenase (NAD(+)) n=1 Tax=freshwater metagenome TaxID=449393 RepID=A0A6J6SH00_9ZZZZ|nr:aldehyde dehydrogenase family protein [Actinomycetota bacterium]MSW78848.1 aldehyde dehydrogenase family protein [Actinomycetota bacterium]MSX93598.1 aldehyde dehydrogenase family protein [Actinomycetota bacterium]MSZ83764.1 aldehyde dehydrogenase family protein [Actinomycetota bacterium]MTB18646.1 aldehyde dehydrogenase family protein [Actinomycetota bacterium]
MRAYENIFINGQWIASTGTDTLSVTDSTTEEIIATIPDGSAADVDKAVAAAKAAFPAWSALPKEARAEYLMKIQAGLDARTDELASTIAREVGMPIFLSNIIQAGLPKANFGIAAGLLSTYEFEQTVGNALIVREAIGVVGCITPWNYPLHQIALKVAPALAAGNTVVVKPSEVAPINAFILAEVIEAAGLPAGVFNLVTGVGTVVGEAIASHPDVDMVSFTGSTRAGKRVAEVASQTVKKVSLELGGKSANVILADADFEKAVKDGVAKCLLNSGQTCTALTRMLVPRERLAEAAQIAGAAAETFTPGNPFEKTTRLGPLVSAAQRERVRGFINKGIEEGATLVTGGAASPEGLDKGFFVSPTVFSNVDRTMTIAREEIFGPVLSIMPYDTEAEAIEIANDTIYGLAGGVWGEPEHAKAVARQIRAGQVEVNGGPFNVLAPFGGYKQSGLGREAGTFGFEEFTEVKALLL